MKPNTREAIKLNSSSDKSNNPQNPKPLSCRLFRLHREHLVMLAPFPTSLSRASLTLFQLCCHHELALFLRFLSQHGVSPASLRASPLQFCKSLTLHHCANFAASLTKHHCACFAARLPHNYVVFIDFQIDF